MSKLLDFLLKIQNYQVPIKSRKNTNLQADRI